MEREVHAPTPEMIAWSAVFGCTASSYTTGPYSPFGIPYQTFINGFRKPECELLPVEYHRRTAQAAFDAFAEAVWNYRQERQAQTVSWRRTPTLSFHPETETFQVYARIAMPQSAHLVKDRWS